MDPPVDLSTEPPSQLLLNGGDVRLIGVLAHQRGHNPMLAIGVGVNIGGKMNVENGVSFTAPFLVEKKTCLRVRGLRRDERHGAGQTFHRIVVTRKFG